MAGRAGAKEPPPAGCRCGLLLERADLVLDLFGFRLALVQERQQNDQIVLHDEQGLLEVDDFGLVHLDSVVDVVLDGPVVTLKQLDHAQAPSGHRIPAAGDDRQLGVVPAGTAVRERIGLG